MKNEKLCPHCKQWSAWTGHISDKCTHCDHYLRHEERVHTINLEHKRQKMEMDFNAKWPFHVRPGDNFILIIFKKIGFGIFAAFMGIISFFAWLMFWIAS